MADKLEDIQGKLQSAFNALTGPTLDLLSALGSYEGAVGDLQSAVDSGLLGLTEGRDLMDQITFLARVLTQNAVQDAAARVDNSSEQQKLSDAQAELAAGDGLRTMLAFKSAITNYKDAVSLALGIV